MVMKWGLWERNGGLAEEIVTCDRPGTSAS